MMTDKKPEFTFLKIMKISQRIAIYFWYIPHSVRYFSTAKNLLEIVKQSVIVKLSMPSNSKDVILDLYAPKETGEMLTSLAVATGKDERSWKNRLLGKIPSIRLVVQEAFQTYANIVHHQARGRVLISVSPETSAYLRQLRPDLFETQQIQSLPPLVDPKYHRQTTKFFKETSQTPLPKP